MSIPTAKLADGRTVKLGRIRPTTPPECLRFASYRDPRGATPPPAVVDYSAKAMAAISRMYDNDALGCCVIAGKMHQLGIWSGNETGTPVLATDTEVREQYVNICGPGDNGCVITDVLNAFQSPRSRRRPRSIFSARSHSGSIFLKHGCRPPRVDCGT